MNNAERIAGSLDHHLTEKTEIVVFGSAALLLDPRYARHFAARVTNDVDIIIPAERELKVDSDQGFWRAIEAANKELEPDGLYVTHIFPEREVALTPEWQQHTVRLEIPNLNNLTIVRPRVLDLIVSKMGRATRRIWRMFAPSCIWSTRFRDKSWPLRKSMQPHIGRGCRRFIRKFSRPRDGASLPPSTRSNAP